MLHVIVGGTRTLRIYEAAAAERELKEVAVLHNFSAGKHERGPAREQPIEKWLHDVGPQLRKVLDARDNECLVVVGAPRTLAQMKAGLPGALRRRVHAQVPLDLAREDSAALSTHLRPAMRTALRRAEHGEESGHARALERRPAA
jgi:hypothetical protein